MKRLIAGLTFAGLLVCTDVSAQSSLQIPLQLDFVNPGAKSLALAGAFAGVADDATGGFANPAGLRELGRPELSVELRGRWMESAFLDRGRLSGAVQNQGLDVTAGPVFGHSPDNQVGVSYFAVVFPFPRRRAVIAGFRHELARVDQTYLAQGVFQQDPTELTSQRNFPQKGLRQLAITSYGAAGALELTSRISVGAALSVYRFELLSDFRPIDTMGFFGPPNPNIELGRSAQQGSDTRLAPTFGVRACLKDCQDRQGPAARFGVVYRRGPSFDFNTIDGPDRRNGNSFRVPDTLAVGAAFELPQSGRRLLVAAEITRIGYSRLVKDFVTDQTISRGLQDRFTINDGTEFHLGVQYTLETPAWLPRFRGGVWSDPDHTTHYITGPVAPSAGGRLQDELMTASLSQGKRRTHYAGGIGLTFSPKLEWNAGADVTSDLTVVSTSVILKLGQ